MINIIFWELKRRKSAILWWTIGTVAMTTLILALFPSIRDQAVQMNEVINKLPAEIRGMKSGGSAKVDVGDPIDFLNSQLYYATLPIIWIILAITRGSSTLGREENHHTLELLLARPISRTKILLAKLISFMVEFLIVGSGTLVTIFIVAPLVDIHISSMKLILATLYTVLFCMSFGLLAFTLQAFSQKTRHLATAVSVTIGFGGYLLASLGTLTDWLHWPVKFFPYHYFTPIDALQGKTPRGLLLYLICLFIICITLSIIGFRRRDID